MQDIAIYGAGGFGREIALMIRQINEARPQWNLRGFYDDKWQTLGEIDRLPVLGGIKELNANEDPVAIALAVGDPAIRKKIRAGIRNPSVFFPALIHPSVNRGDTHSNRIGEGTLITAGNIITTNVNIGAFVIINLACTVGHDVKLGDFVSIMPGCSLSGFIEIGPEAYIGSGARILPGITIGDRANIGAGAVVTRPVAAGTTVVGVPAREINSDTSSQR